MKAVYKETEGAYTACLTERPVPTLTKQDNVLIRVHACTTCGLDMHIWQGKLRDCRPPIIMGHEFVGTIVKAVGESLGFSVGERVICQPHLYAWATPSSAAAAVPWVSSGMAPWRNI